MRCSDILSTLDRLSDGHARDHATLAVMAKMWALFALGELYSTRCIQRDDAFPGLSAFSYASQVLRVVSERPVLDVVEALLLLVRMTKTGVMSGWLIKMSLGIILS